ncbi:hypothetical protein, partial [Salmonella sp. SAL4457]|uniref:hypothetical protein n=1 Tax=Salmonella sp. SAL4457 TaxID=3159912 RepID=UPI0039795BA9
SALAFMIAGNKSCAEIVQMVEEGDERGLIAGYAYNSLFAASDLLERPGHAPEAARDRLLAMVGQVDVAKSASPDEDKRY